MAESIASRVVDAYEVIGQHHASRALDSVYNDYYERPVMYSLLGDVDGKKVLDAGCGPGSYAEWLVARGAEVLGIDSSPQMLKLARSRLGSSVDVRLADLNMPLTFIDTASFDVVLCALVLDYIEDWDGVFKEFSRILVEKGLLVFSVHHPFFLDLKVEAIIDESYFATQLLQEDWRPFGLEIPAYRRPLGAMASALWEAGFLIEQIIEPKPTEECMEAYPQHYEALSKHPVFICVSAQKTQ